MCHKIPWLTINEVLVFILILYNFKTIKEINSFFFLNSLFTCWLDWVNSLRVWLFSCSFTVAEEFLDLQSFCTLHLRVNLCRFHHPPTKLKLQNFHFKFLSWVPMSNFFQQKSIFSKTNMILIFSSVIEKKINMINKLLINKLYNNDNNENFN